MAKEMGATASTERDAVIIEDADRQSAEADLAAKIDRSDAVDGVEVEGDATPDDPLRVALRSDAPSARALRAAMREVAERAAVKDVVEFARDLRIELDDDLPRRPQSGAPGRRYVAAGAIGGAMIAASAMLAFNGADFLGDRSIAARDAAIASGDLETATIDAAETGVVVAAATGGADKQPYLAGAELRAALATTPIKCVVSEGSAAAGGAAGCREVIIYDVTNAAFTRHSPVETGATLEINGAFAVSGDAICHFTGGMTAHIVGGELSDARARAIEEIAEAAFARVGGAPACHRLRATATPAQDAQVYRADVFVNNVKQEAAPPAFTLITAAELESLRR